MTKTTVAIIGSGNIGTDLTIKILRLSDTLEVGAMVGVDPASDGLISMPDFDGTSTRAPTTSTWSRAAVRPPSPWSRRSRR